MEKSNCLIRFVRWTFSWRTIRKVLFVLISLITLAVFLYAEETWRGNWEWKNFKRQWEAKGEKFDFADFVPPPVPDDQNFCATPLLAELFSYKGIFSEYKPHTEQELKRYEEGSGKWEESLQLYALDIYSVIKSGRRPSAGNFQLAEPTDFHGWQEYYRSTKDFPMPAKPGQPAQDVLVALSRYDPVIAELRAAAHRPHARLLLHYEEGPAMRIMPLGLLRRANRVLNLRAKAELELGKTDEAFADVEVAFRLQDALRSAPTLIISLIRLAVLPLDIGMVWEGLAKHQWTDKQIEALQKQLSQMDCLADYQYTIRSERAWGNGIWSIYHSQGRLFMIQNQLAINRFFQEQILPLVDAKQRRVFPEQVRATEKWAKGGMPYNPYNAMAKSSAGVLVKMPELFARAQTTVDLAMIACALERYRIARDQYPDTLDALVPQFIGRLPHDIINGQPLKYRRTEDGQFILYSVGWNEKDDGSIVGKKGWDFAEGDWVWRYPTK